MTSKLCFTSPQSKSDLNQLGTLLLQHYNKNIETKLNEQDQALLENVADKLEELSTNNGIQFNKEEFKSFIKRVFVYDFTQFGGDPLDEVVPYSNRSSSYSTTTYILADFTALVGFFLSLFLLYLAYENLSQLTQRLTGATPTGIGQEVMDQYNSTLEELRRSNISQLSYLQFAYQIFTTFSCGFIENQVSNIQQIIYIGLTKSFTGIAERAQASCLSSAENTGTFAGMVISFFNVASAPDVASACVNERIRIEQKLIGAQIDALRDSVFNEIRTRKNMLIGNVTLAIRIGVPCTTYLLGRIAYLTAPIREKISNTMSRVRIEDSDEDISSETRPFIIAERGGNRKKNKKHRKTSRKYIKTSRKYKKTSRKHKKTSRKHRKN
jgi:hypothetical protein